MDSEERDDYYKRLEGAKRKFYEQNQKNTLFKNKQKLECAQTVSDEFDLKKMVECTAFIVPGRNIVYYNYLVYKLYGNESNRLDIYDHMRGLICNILERYDTFEMHVNLKTFTISAGQRYYGVIASSFDENTILTDKLSKIVVYNTPSIVSQLTTLLYPIIKDVLPRMEYHHKETSEQLINVLFNI
jgi:hypothetical protein